MILEGDFGKIQPAMKEPLEQALDSSNRMAGLVSDLLNVSRMEAGRFFIDPTDVDLNSEVPAEVVQLKTLAESKSVKLVYDKPAKPVPMMKLDLDKTRQVIMNLADNAVHYSAPPNGGGVVHVSLAHEGQDVVFKVVDNGIGVPEAQQKKLFKKFFRAGNAQNTRPDGTGLGLYLVKRVVEDQGGELIFESKEGKGSTFGFRMPVKNKIKPNSKASEKLNKAQYSPVPGAIQPTQDEKDTAAKEQEAADEEAAAKKAKK
jgi:signal transduction histidine kinase